MTDEKRSKRKPQLHEILAVEGELEGIFKRIIEETIHTLAKKPNLFMGYHKKLELFEENESDQTPDEVQEITETVPDKLEYAAQHIKRYFKAIFQKEYTNQMARADLIVDGEILARDLPGTFLLGLESRLKMIAKIYEAIPTLSPGRNWVADPQKGKHIYTAQLPDERMKTAKTFQHKVLYAATDHHPAQIERWEEQVNIGRYVQHNWCGMITSAQKSALLDRIGKMSRAVKQARMRANCTEVIDPNPTIGRIIMDYINQD